MQQSDRHRADILRELQLPADDHYIGCMGRFELRKRIKVSRNEMALESQSLSSLDEIPGQTIDANESEWESEWQRNLLKTALEQVKRHVREAQYQLFDLYVIRQWPVDRITQTLGVSATRVYLAKYRITRRLKKEVRRLEARWNSG
jgi:DNA-directed RNA polymerase specialized sigma24 family protein